jgi:hypothetical protein
MHCGLHLLVKLRALLRRVRECDGGLIVQPRRLAGSLRARRVRGVSRATQRGGLCVACCEGAAHSVSLFAGAPRRTVRVTCD